MFKQEIDILIRCDQQANQQSLPLRFGFNFQPDEGFKSKKLKLFNLEDISMELNFANRRHLVASFYDNEQKGQKAYFVVARNGNYKDDDFFNPVTTSQIFLVAVYPVYEGFNIKKEAVLSNTVQDLIIKNEFDLDDVVKLYPYYKESKLSNKKELLNIIEEIKSKKVKSNVIDFDKKRPLTLKDVVVRPYKSRRGKKVDNICLKFKETEAELRNNWSRGFENRLQHCQILIGKKVTATVWKSYNSEVWFKDISEYKN